MIRFLPLILLLLAGFHGAGPSQAADRHARVARQDGTGVALEVRVPSHAYRMALDEQGRRTLAIEGFGTVAEPGRPELPARVLSFAVPDGATFRLAWTEGPETRHAGPPVKTAEPRAAADGRDAGERDLTLPQDGVWPVARVEAEEVRFRDLRIVRVTIRPARYDPDSQELLLVSALDVELRFEGGRGFAAPAEGTPERQVAKRLANRDSLLAAPARSAGPPARLSTDPSGARRESGAQAMGLPAVKIRVAGEGLVRVDRATLEAAGLSAAALDALDPRNLQLYHRSTPVPCRGVGEQDGSFDPGDAVEFYGAPTTSRYFDARTYLLAEQAGAGTRFTSRDVTPAGAPTAATFAHVERFEDANSIYTFGNPAAEGDPHFFWVWFEDNPNPPRVTTFSRQATLPGVDPSGDQATLRALFSGRTDPPENPDHRVRFRVNGTEVGETSWNGQALHLAEIPFDPQLLLPGDNTFQVEYVATAIVDIYYMDWIEVEYPRSLAATGDALILGGRTDGPTRYAVSDLATAVDPVLLDVTDPLLPVELTGFDVHQGQPGLVWQDDAEEPRRYLVAGDGGRIAPSGIVVDTPSSLRDLAGGADLIVVVPEGWEAALQPLVEARRARGLRVVLANLTDVADEFAGGNVDDVALRDFVAWAYHNWEAPAPSYLLLVGEPNLDATNQMQSSSHHHYMPTHFGVTVELGETMSDTWLGAVSGDDLLPDLAVGRLSVRRASDAAAVVNKILGYEATPAAGNPWIHNVVQVAANHVLFEQSLEESAALLPQHFSVDPQYRLAGATAASIQDAAGAGALLLSFTGHGNVSYWADKPGGAFFTTTSVFGMDNAGRLPLMTAMNCLNGLIGHPTQLDSLAEKLVNDPQRGAIAMWSPSALGFLVDYQILQSNLYRQLFHEHQPVMGLAAHLALVEAYLTEPIALDVVKEMVFVGDPSGFMLVDADDDAMLDDAELRLGSDPGDRDTDDDGLIDGIDGADDVDGDGLAALLDADSDNDALPDGLELGLTVPDADTDVSRGSFRPDADPASTTDPADADSDGGGAPDGAEDLNANGAVDDGETDPLDPLDDPACSLSAPAEVAAVPEDQLRLDRTGDHVALSWGSVSDDPCLLYRVYAADDGASGTAGFRVHAVTPATSYVHSNAAADGRLYRYLIVGATLAHGEGPWGRD